MPDSFDLIVIGGGPGGYTAAIRARSSSCRWPASRSATRSPRRHVPQCRLHPEQGAARLQRNVRDDAAQTGQRHGIRVGSVALDLPAMLARKDKVVSELVGGVAGLFKKYKVTPLYGAGKLLGRKQG